MRQLFCWLGWHNLIFIKRIGNVERNKVWLVQCNKCLGSYALNNKLKILLPFDAELCDLHDPTGKRGLRKYISSKRYAWYW